MPEYKGLGLKLEVETNRLLNIAAASAGVSKGQYVVELIEKAVKPIPSINEKISNAKRKNIRKENTPQEKRWNGTEC